jgi:hypothetical protein
MEDDRTGSVGVKQAAMVKAVAISTLNIKAAKRAQTNQPKVMTIARLESAWVFYKLHDRRTVRSSDKKLYTSDGRRRSCKTDDRMMCTEFTEKRHWSQVSSIVDQNHVVPHIESHRQSKRKVKKDLLNRIPTLFQCLEA